MGRSNMTMKAASGCRLRADRLGPKRERGMFERLFQWTSRNGARVLFALALFILVFQAINGIVVYLESIPAEDMYGHAAPGRIAWSLVSTIFVAGLQAASLPLIG